MEGVEGRGLRAEGLMGGMVVGVGRLVGSERINDDGGLKEFLL